MGEHSLAKRCGAVVLIQLFILIVAVIAAVGTAYAEDESIEVSCYKGNSEEGNYVGNLTVTKPANAGQECNSTYYDCDGKCVGCYTDQNLGKTVCSKPSGGDAQK